MELTPPAISSKHFLWHHKDKKLTAEISELSCGFSGNVWYQIYDDALDVGIAIMSEATGRIAVFVQNHTERDSDDLKWWELIPTKNTIRKCPELNGVKVVIYND